MGGDFGVEVTIPASLIFLKNNSSVFISFYGDLTQINKQIRFYPDLTKTLIDRFEVFHCNFYNRREKCVSGDEDARIGRG